MKQATSNETKKKHQSFLFKVAIPSLKAKVKNLSTGNSNLAIKYFDITVIWKCNTCGISHTCTIESTKALCLYGNLTL